MGRLRIPTLDHLDNLIEALGRGANTALCIEWRYIPDNASGTKFSDTSQVESNIPADGGSPVGGTIKTD
ncbi:hypothetical protein PHLCEN_2v2514 [Hermanssonia centrifuga]|uniref:Uncharacterized protein n=1 Tax=Hermanssonia centrifuga TaxID=98765 RepID=A0A2R6RLU4_9APHY|nr:hypothetical protein PHLCEN_2v2514 [Hermanssonia centrifuga]